MEKQLNGAERSAIRLEVKRNNAKIKEVLGTVKEKT